MKTFVIGGARSGKSSVATTWAREHTDDVCCIVTATASDSEMAARIAAHRKERPASWRVREEPVRLGSALLEVSGQHAMVLIDCLTVWTANCLWPHATANAIPSPPSSSDTSPSGELLPDRELWAREREAFLDAVRTTTSPLILVSNEVGTGIIPMNAAARTFVDEQGWLNQRVAALCDEVYQVIAGIPVRIKSSR